MSEIIPADPLAFLDTQTGRVSTPNKEQGAVGASQLDSQQRAAKIGEPVPIVFGRWRSGAGGVFISPGATDCRFENDPVSNDVTAYYHFVLSQGLIDPIPVSDVFQRICRVGTHAQAYDRRAGGWTPGHFIVAVPGKRVPQASQYCGSIGAYPNMSTLSFIVTVPDGFDSWNRQVHVFIRGGMHVNRLLEGTFGPSDNFADLVQWLLIEGVKLPTLMVDSFRLQIAAEFLDVNGFTCNAIISESTNYSELVNKWAPYFLVTETNNGGEKSLRPLLPINEDGTLNLDEIEPEYTFSEFDILPDSFEIEYVNYADRRPFVAQMVWRQQLEADIGIIRTSEVKYAGTAADGPFESHDLSQFCTRENHAVKAGAYILSKRVRSTHMIRFTAAPGAHNRILTPGSIIWVTLIRAASGNATSTHSRFYQIERIGKTLAGEVSYECSYFPVDEQRRSLIALDVASVNGSGILYSIEKTGVTCDINDEDDTTIPPSPPLPPTPNPPLPPSNEIPGPIVPPLPEFISPPAPPYNRPPNPQEDPPLDESPDTDPPSAIPPDMNDEWPEGKWDPEGGNKWTFIATEKVSVGPCESPLPMADDSVVVTTAAGEGAWAANASFTKADFCTNDVNAYEFWLKIYTSDHQYLGNITQSTIVSYLRTGGLAGGFGWSSSRSYSLITRVEPADPDAPGVEDFPPPEDFFDRYG
jgi:hypothetical protein